MTLGACSLSIRVVGSSTPPSTGLCPSASRGMLVGGGENWPSLVCTATGVIDGGTSSALAAGAALGVTIIGFNLLGDGLRDLLDPRIKER